MSVIGFRCMNLLKTTRNYWNNLHTYQAGYVGLFACLATGVIPGFIFGETLMIVSFFLLWLCWAWLYVRAIKSGFTKEAFFFYSFFAEFLGTKYGIFCLSWHFTFIFFAWAFFGLS